MGSADGSEHFSDERMRGGSFKDVVNCLLLSRSQDKPTVVLECLEKELTYLHQRISTNAVPASIKDRSNHFSKSCKHLWYNKRNHVSFICLSHRDPCHPERHNYRSNVHCGDLFCAPIALQVSVEPANFWHPAPTPLYPYSLST